MSSSYLHGPLKRTIAVDLIKPLSGYIKNTFSNDVLNEHKDILAELNQLRGNAVIRSLDKHVTSLETLKRYYDQLVIMEAKLPITENQIRVSFTWYSAFDKGSIFSSKCSLSSGAYERFCVLFNIASLMSQLAYSENHSTDDGLKNAAKYYQQAAGIYTYLRDNVQPMLQTLPTPDLSVSCLKAFSSVMLAQAQDCFYLKASSDKMKNEIVARLAMQAADFYQEAVRSSSHYEVKSLWEKDWLPILQCKQHFFTAASEYHQSYVCLDGRKYGEQVGRLQKAEKFIKDALKVGGNYTPQSVRTMSGEITKQLAAAKKDNEFIYLDTVPAIDQLGAIDRASLAKPLPVTTPLSTNFQDLFSKLVPMEVHRALADYENAKGTVINMEIGKLREATQFLNGILASLNLPAAIEDSGNKVPASVLEKSAEVKQKGGLESIDQMMQNLPDLLVRNREVLDESFRMLDEEEEDDEKMRAHFKERWTRTPSKKLTQQLRNEGIKYKNVLDNATNADGVVKAKYNEHRRALEILSKSEGDLTACLPKSGAATTGGAGDAVQELRLYMQQVEQIKSQRESWEGEFKNATTDMASKFLQALAAEGYLDSQRITGENLDELFAELRTGVAESIETQKKLVDQIQAANERFTSANQSGGVNPREKMLKELASAYDAFIELTENLQEGTKFYNDLTNILLKFQGKVNDLVFARKTEKEDFSKELQQQAAKGTNATPSVPSHHKQQQQQQQPPERPPAPNRPPVAAPRQDQYAYNPEQPPPFNPAAPYPQNVYMPQPGYYAPPGGMQPYPVGGYPQQPMYGGYPPQFVPPYAQQQPRMGYQGYQYQRPPPR